jgi:chromosome segregation ATPase
MADSENRIAHPMNEALTALNGNAGALLVVMSLGILLFLATLTYHTVELRRERRSQTGQLTEQLGRTMAGLQKINSSIIAQTNETKERLGTLRPAIEQADQLLRDATNFTSDFKAVRAELRQLDEHLEGLNLAAAQSATAQAEATGALSELKQHLGTLRQEVAASAQPQPAQPTQELRQIQEQVGAIRQAVAAAAQTQATGTSSLRSDLSAFAAEQSRATQAMRDSLAAELRQQETRFRQLTDKFLAESTELRSRIESQSRTSPAPRQVTPEVGHAAKAELDAEARKEFRKIAERLDSLQTRIEDIIKF